MSRWIEYFENHAFHENWKVLNQNLENLEILDKTVKTDILEVARLKKVMTYLDKLLVACDPELVPQTIWDHFNQQVVNCVSETNSYIQNKNIGHIKNANTFADNLLSYLRPYVVNGKGAAQAAGRAFKEYSKAIKRNIQEFELSVTDTVSSIKENKENGDHYFQKIEESQLKIEVLKKELLEGEDDQESIQEQIHTIKNEMEAWHEEIKIFHDDLTVNKDEEASIIQQIKTSRKNAEENERATAEYLESSKGLIGELKNFYVRIFGKNGETEESSGSLKNQLDKRLKQLNETIEIHSKKYKEIEDEIESLIGGATTAGLATAYNELKKTFVTPIDKYTKLFYSSLIAIVFLSISSLLADFFIFKIDFTSTEQLLNNLLYKLPFLLPLIWLTIFASKRRSENSRLHQEYAHKEAVAISYQSFKTQIKELKQADNEMLIKLMDTAILAIAFNASETLDGKHGDKMPMEDIFSKALEKVEQLDFNLKKQK